MTYEGWREAVLAVVADHERGDDTGLDLMARLLAEQDRAKQVLRDKGYGCTGMPWIDVVGEVPPASDSWPS